MAQLRLLACVVCVVKPRATGEGSGRGKQPILSAVVHPHVPLLEACFPPRGLASGLHRSRAVFFKLGAVSGHAAEDGPSCADGRWFLEGSRGPGLRSKSFRPEFAACQLSAVTPWLLGTTCTVFRLNVALCCLGFYSPRPASKCFVGFEIVHCRSSCAAFSASWRGLSSSEPFCKFSPNS